MQEKIKNEVAFRQGIGEIEALIEMGERDSVIRLGLPMGSEITRYMNADAGQQSIERIYWAVVPAAVRGVVDQVRTLLTQLVAELRAATPRGEATPTAEAVHQAIQVAVHGKRARVNVTTAQATNNSTATAARRPGLPADSEFWTRSRRLGAFIVGIAGVAGAVFAAIQAF